MCRFAHSLFQKHLCRSPAEFLCSQRVPPLHRFEDEGHVDCRKDVLLQYTRLLSSVLAMRMVDRTVQHTVIRTYPLRTPHRAGRIFVDRGSPWGVPQGRGAIFLNKEEHRVILVVRSVAPTGSLLRCGPFKCTRWSRVHDDSPERFTSRRFGSLFTASLSDKCWSCLFSRCETGPCSSHEAIPTVSIHQQSSTAQSPACFTCFPPFPPPSRYHHRLEQPV